MKKCIYQLVLITLLFVTSCATVPDGEHGIQDDDSATTYVGGYWDDNKYINEYFGFELTLPLGYSIQNKINKEQLLDIGAKAFSKDKNEKLLLSAQLESLHMLVRASKYPPGTPGKTNISLTIMAEDVSLYPGMVTEIDYIGNMKTALSESDLEIAIVEDGFQHTISNVTYEMFLYGLDIGDLTFVQMFYIKRKFNFFVSVTIAFTSNDEYEELVEILSTMTYNADKW
jgi:hypothetical protein